MTYIFLIFICIMSLVAFIAYGHDKRKAINNSKNRTSEKTLLLLTFCGGAIGGLLGMYKFRHKTKHWYFVFMNWLSLIIHLSLLVLLYMEFGLNTFW